MYLVIAAVYEKKINGNQADQIPTRNIAVIFQHVKVQIYNKTHNGLV